jgi:undecaprenyl-diphosphatase
MNTLIELSINSWYKVLVGILIGVVQGISEWLPISSKTQILIISTYLLNLNFSQAYALGLFMEGGTFIAALIYFRKEVYQTLLSLVGKGGKEGRLLLKYLVVVTVVTAIVAIPIYKFISSINGPVIGVPMIVLGILLIVDGVLIKISKNKQSAKKELANLSIMDFVLIGIAQGISALPGVSRSGTTVSAMLFLNIKPEEAFRLSFFALILSSIGATAVTVIFSKPQLNSVFAVFPITDLIIAAIVSIGISLVLIRALITSAKSSKITNLVFLLGAIAIIAGIIGVIFAVG